MAGRLEADVAGVDDLVDGEMREVKLGGDKKALLCRVKGEYFATGHLCSHYNFPLVKGVLSEDGRVMCPYHGACFNAKSGDIEDAPGIDPLASFEVRVDHGRVIVSAENKDVGFSRRQPTVVRRDNRDKRVFVIVGGGPAGEAACETLRNEGFKGSIVLVSKELHLPIDRVRLSKGLKVEMEKLLLRDKDYYASNDIDVKLGCEVRQVDPAASTVTLTNGQTIAYTKLLLATGGTPRNFWPASEAMRNVFVVRSVADADGLNSAVEATPKARILVIGSSFIGMEAASVLGKVASTVTVVGMEKVPFERVLGEKVGLAMQKLHEEKGVKFFMNAVVDAFLPTADGQRCAAVTLKSGERLDADIVVIGAGVRPTTDFLKGALPLERDGSLKVTAELAVEGQPNIYAAGDIARFPYAYNNGTTETHVRVEHWNVAKQHGVVAAKNMLGQTVPFTTVPYFWTMQFGKSVRYCGHALSFDDVVIEGDLSTHTFIAYYLKGNAVIAVASMGRDPAASQAAELMRHGKLPSAADIRAGKSIMDVALGGPLSANGLAQRAAAAAAAAAAPAPAAAGSASASAAAAGKPATAVTTPAVPDHGFPIWTALVGLVAVAVGIVLYYRSEQK